MLQLKSPDGSTEVKAALHVASSYGESYLRTLDELLKAPDINLNIINWEGQLKYLTCLTLSSLIGLFHPLYWDDLSRL